MQKLNLNQMQGVKGGQGVPFTQIVNNGCGPLLPNLNGFFNSANALVNAGVFGAPLVINGGGNNGAACPG